MDEKMIFLEGEGDAYFYRNKNAMEEKGISPWVNFLADLARNKHLFPGGGRCLKLELAMGRI